MRKSTPDTKNANYDFFGKFIRAWFAGFISQSIVPYFGGYILFLCSFSPASRSLGLNMALAADLLFIPSAVFTAIIAWLCVTIANRLRYAVIATALISMAIPVLLFTPALFNAS